MQLPNEELLDLDLLFPWVGAKDGHRSEQPTFQSLPTGQSSYSRNRSKGWQLRSGADIQNS
jgi:hypothetical protein